MPSPLYIARESMGAMVPIYDDCTRSTMDLFWSSSLKLQKTGL